MTATVQAPTSADQLLTDEMLARFDERAPQYDRDNTFFTEDFEELRASGYLLASVPTEFGGLGLNLGRDQPAAAPHRLRRPGDRRRRQHAPLLRRPVRRPAPRRRPVRRLGAAQGRRGPRLRRRPRRGRQRHPRAAVVRQGRARRRRLGDHRPQDLRQPVAGVDLPRRPRAWTPATRPTRRSSTPSCTATRPNYRIEETWDTLGHAGDDVQRHDPRPHVRARRGDDARVPGRLRRRRPVPRRPVRLGAARLRRRLLVDRPAGVRRDRRARCTSARRSR